MSRNILLTVFAFFTQLISTNAQRFDWVSFTPLIQSDGSGIKSVTRDNTGNLFTVSFFNDPVIVGSDTLYHVGNLNRPDILITKWDSTGVVLSYRHMANWSTNGNPDPQQLHYDVDNDEILLTISSYYAGMQITLLSNGSEPDSLFSLAHGAVMRFSTNLDFISKNDLPGGGAYSTASSVKDGFLYAAHGYNSTISKTDTAGTMLWSITPTGSSYYITDLAISNNDTIYVIGYCNYGGGPGTTLGGIEIIPPAPGNNNDVILFKLDSAGNVISGKHLVQASNYIFPLQLNLDAAGNVFVGVTYETPGLVMGSFTLSTTPDGRDVFIAKLDHAFEPLWVTEITTPGDTYINDLIIQPSGKVVAAGQYAGNTTIGGYTLAFAQYGSGYLTQMDNITGNILYATNLGSLSAGSSNPNCLFPSGNKVFIGGACVGNAGFPQWTASFGCYTLSRTRAYLTVLNDTVFVSPSVSLQFTSPDLVASANVAGATYQWFLNGVEIPGETGSSITPDSSGVYEVVLNYFGCITSDTLTITITTVDLMENFASAPELTKVWSDPSGNQVHIINAPQGATITMSNISGQIIYCSTTNTGQLTLNTSGIANGVYIIRIEYNRMMTNRKLVLNR